MIIINMIKIIDSRPLTVVLLLELLKTIFDGFEVKRRMRIDDTVVDWSQSNRLVKLLIVWDAK